MLRRIHEIVEVGDDYYIISGFFNKSHGQLLLKDFDDCLCYGGLDYDAVTSDCISLTRLNIKPEHRWKGLGKKMIAHLQKYAKDTNKMITVSPGGYDIPLEKQIKFYESCGFFPDNNKEGLYTWIAY